MVVSMEKDQDYSGSRGFDGFEDSFGMYLDEINKSPLLSAEEEIYLSKKVQEGSKKALDKLIKSNLRLVVKIAKQYNTREYQLMDIIQDGNMGLIKAAERFDHNKGVRFSTYAAWWIKQSIVRSLSIKKRLIRLPHRKEEKLRAIKNEWNALYQHLKRVPTVEELAESLKMEVHAVEEIMALSNPVVFLESSVSEDECMLLNMLEDTNYSPDEMVIKEHLRVETREILDTLVPKERSVLIQRYGLDESGKSTLKAMGAEYGISAETVRQIEMKALKKIRDEFSHLREYLQ